jgi:hypothetical protein
MKLIRKKEPRDTGIVDLNVLPRALRPADVPAFAVVLVVALFASVVGMVPLAYAEHSARQDAQVMERQADDADQSIHRVQLAIDRKRALQAQVDEVLTKVTALRTAREHVQGGKRPLAVDLARVIDGAVVPPGTRVVSLTGTDTGMRVEGAAAGPLEAIAYAGNLMRAAGFTSARMASFAPGKDGGGQFTIEVTR